MLPLDIKLRDVALEYTYAQGIRLPTGKFQIFIPPIKEQGVTYSSSTPAQNEATEFLTFPVSLRLPNPARLHLRRCLLRRPPLQRRSRSTMPQLSAGSCILKIERWHHPKRCTGKTYVSTLVVLDTLRCCPATFAGSAYNEDGAPVEFKGDSERKRRTVTYPRVP